MGTTYFVCNSAKRQYFDPDGMGSGENSKRSGVLWGLSGHALAHLLLPGAELGFHLTSWIGDPLFLVGDNVEPNTIDHLRPFQQGPDQDAYHIVTEQFDNITLNLIAYLCRNRIQLEHFLNDAEQWPHTFINLAHTIAHLSADDLERGFTGRFGLDWKNRYYETLKQEPWHYALPMTPETTATPGPKIIRAVDVLRARRSEIGEPAAKTPFRQPRQIN